MAYPEDLDSKYNLKDANINFAQGDNDIMPFDDTLFKQGYRNADESATDSVPDAHNVNWMYDILYRNLRYTKDTAIENKNLIANKKATTTSLGQIKVGQGLKILSDGTLTLASPVIGDKQSITYDIPVGMFMLWGGKGVPDDTFIEPDGRTITKELYPELFQWAVDNYSNGTDFSNLFTGTVSSNRCVLKNMLGDFIKIASDTNVGTHENASLPTLTVSSTTHNHGTITSGAGTKHRHGWGTLKYTSTGQFKYVITNENATIYSDYKRSGNLEGSTVSYNSGSKWGFDGDSDCNIVTLNINTSNGTVSGDMDYESSHKHDITINGTGSHNHTITHSAGTNNNGKVIPANWGLKLILKAKPSQPIRTVPIGTVLDYTGNPTKLPPEGFIYANGATLERNTYNDLYNWAVQNNLMRSQSSIPSTPHAFYGDGDGSTTFTIPDLRTAYRRSEDNNIGHYENDGAPDIQGYFYADSTPSLSENSVYTFENATGSGTQRGFVTSNVNQTTKIKFNASGSHTCYGRHNYVQPRTVVTLPILKY